MFSSFYLISIRDLLVAFTFEYKQMHLLWYFHFEWTHANANANLCVYVLVHMNRGQLLLRLTILNKFPNQIERKR